MRSESLVHFWDRIGKRKMETVEEETKTKKRYILSGETELNCIECQK